MISVDRHFPNASKEVRFASSPPSSFHRAHSIATENVPLLPQVSSASKLPKQSFRVSQPGPGIDIDAYIENCRNLNEQLRVAHETERRAWNIERSALKAKIADLEFALNKTKDKRRSSIESSASSTQHTARSDFRAMYSNNNKSINPDVGRSISETAIHTTASASPVWRAAENGTPTTRVFSHEDTGSNHHLPSISEDDAFPSLSKQVSPTSHVAPIESVPIPIEVIEPTLDGITLRSAALTSSFATKITSPQFGSPVLSPPTNAKTDANGMHIETSSLLHPLDEKLRRHAGHTPMNYEGAEASGEPSGQMTEQPTPQQEKPIAPAPSARPPLRPSEGSESYFSTVSDCDINEEKDSFPQVEQEPREQFEPDDDKPLRGPLMLDPSARTRAADDFLSSVDAKLMQAVKEVSPTRRSSIFSESGSAVMVPATALQNIEQSTTHVIPEEKEPDDDMPRLKMRKSSNFGSAYGASMPGRF